MDVKEHLQLLAMMIPSLLLVGLVVILVAFPAQSAQPARIEPQRVSAASEFDVEAAVSDHRAQLASVPAEKAN
jgi:hypothetical protein